MKRIKLSLLTALRTLCVCSFIIAVSSITAVTFTVTSLANAQSVNELVTEAQNPAPANCIEVDGGYRFDYKSSDRSESYYRVSFKGSLVKSEGTPFKYASGLDLASPALTRGSGDRNRFSLRFEGGTTTVGGGMFEANGVQPLTLRGLEALNLREVGLAAGDADGKNIQLAIGLESPPLRIPGFQHSQVSNWIVVGINAQRQEDTESSIDDKNFGLLTYRAFLGRAFGWRKSGDVGKTASKIADTFLSQAPTYEDAKTLAEKIEQIDAGERSSFQQLFLDAVGETESETDWTETVRDNAYGGVDVVADQPTFAVYAEDSGWCSFTDSSGERRLKNLLTLTLDYWFLPTYDYAFLRVRYENGYERAVPTDRKDHLLLSVGLRF